MAGKRIVIPNYMPALDLNGFPLPGAKITFYENETTTLAAVYANEALTTPLTNPVVANLAGVFPSIFADEDLVFTVAITDADDNPIGGLRNKDEVRPSQVYGADAAAAENANAAAQDALSQINDIVANAPDAPSVVGKAAKAANLSDLEDPLEATDNIQTLQDATGAVNRSQRDKNNDVLNAADFGITGTGSGDIAKLQAALANAILTGRKLILPAGTFQASGLSAIIDTYLPYAASFGPSIWIEGAGSDKTILDNRQANGFLFDIGTDTTLKFVRGGCISNLTITKDSGATVANSSGIQVNATTNFVLENLVIQGISGTGIRIKCEDGDPDGNVNVRTSNVRIDTCAGWGWDGAASVGHNENSFLSTQDVFVQNCGTNEATAITGITQANPAVVTSANHGRVNGDIVYIGGVQGMTQVNTCNSEVAYVVAGATTNTFQLSGINSTGYTAFSTRTATITGITKASPAVVTAASHGFANGEVITIAGVGGMTQVNGVTYRVASVTTNTFALITQAGANVDSTTYGTYTSGGTAAPPLGNVVSARPNSGGVKWKGQISKHDNLAMTLNKNVSLYVEQGPATAQGLDLSGVVIENPQYCGAIIAGCANVRSAMGQSYCNSALSGAQCYFGWVLDGTSTVVQNVNISQHVVRATANDPDYAQWVMVGGSVAPQTIRVRDTIWDNFGYTRQKRFTSQWRFDTTYSDGIACVAVGASEAYVQSSSFTPGGAFVPIRLRYAIGGDSSDGEWASRYINQVLITKPGSDGVYNVYLYDNANVVTAEAVSDAPVRDAVSGFYVKTGDSTRLWVGRLAVSGGSWITAGGGFLNPQRPDGPQPGVPISHFFNEADRSWNTKTVSTLPSSINDFNFKYYPTFDASGTNDFASIAAGAAATFNITSGVTANLGDLVKAVSCSIDTGGLILSARISASNTITVTAFNPTAGAIDLANATFYVRYERR